MKKEIIRLCSEIKLNNRCKGCGGNFTKFTCKYCGGESKELEKLIEELCSRLVEFDDYDIEVVNALYSIKGLGISQVNELIAQKKMEEELHRRYDNVIFLISQGKTGSYLCHQAIYYLDNDLFVGENKKYLINQLMNRLLCGKLDILDEEDILCLIKLFVEMFMGLKAPNPRCLFEKLDDDELGSSLYNIIWLDRDKLIELIKCKNYIEILKAIFHECAHTYQKYIVHLEKWVSYGALKQVKETLIRRKVPGYYNENYVKVHAEVEARILSICWSLEYLKANGLQCTNSQILVESMKRDEALLMDDDRTINGVETTVDEAFSMFVIDVSVLQLYPVLRVQYKNVNGKLVAKTKEEILSDYERYKSGELQYNGTPEEIEFLYNYLLGGKVARALSS